MFNLGFLMTGLVLHLNDNQKSTAQKPEGVLVAEECVAYICGHFLAPGRQSYVCHMCVI